MKLASIRSSSKGNIIVVWTDKTKLLIDCGISGKEAEAGIRELGLAPEELDGILITHEHSDHILGVGVLGRRYHTPIFANENTWTAMESSLGKLKEEQKKSFSHTDPFTIGDIDITPFAISHDAADPVGYSFAHRGKKLGIATDIGILEESLFRALKGCSSILLEANHDIHMLEMGPYPLPLKRRVRGEKGHLSNDEAGKAAEFLARMGVTQILLGHLSETNNYPLLAKKTVENALASAGITPGKDLLLDVAPRTSISKICEV